MRRLILAGVLALSFPIAANADQPRSKVEQRGMPPVPGVVTQGRNAPGWQHEPSNMAWSLQRPPGQHEWKGERTAPYWGPNRHYGGWAPHGGPAVPTYWVWVPGSAVFDYPFSDWREPFGGWGNP
jgi:hypothetical protein